MNSKKNTVRYIYEIRQNQGERPTTSITDAETCGVYEMKKGNAPIVFGRLPFVAHAPHEKDLAKGEGEMVLTWLPQPMLWFRVVKTKNRMWWSKKFFTNRTFIVETPLFSARMFGFPSALHPTRLPILACKYPSRKAEKIVFHVFNFPGFFGRVTSNTGGIAEATANTHRVSEELKLQVDNWVTVLRPLPSTGDRVKWLDAKGGYWITHVGTIQRSDGRCFSLLDAKRLLHSLHYFLSFFKGSWIRPCLPVGLGRNVETVWEEWGVAWIQTWQNSQGWFDYHHAEVLAELFPHFVRLMNQNPWKEALERALYYYLISNTINFSHPGGINAGIMLSQAALETLSKTYCVQVKQLMGEKRFRRLQASEKLRVLFRALNISLDIPKEVKNLRKRAKTKKNGKERWKDGPHAFTDMRNENTHARQEQYGKERGVTFEAWNLGQWYVELAILALLGYAGDYSNRLKLSKWAGQVEPVPWAAAKT